MGERVGWAISDGREKKHCAKRATRIQPEGVAAQTQWGANTASKYGDHEQRPIRYKVVATMIPCMDQSGPAAGSWPAPATGAAVVSADVSIGICFFV